MVSVNLGDVPPGATRAIASLNTDANKAAAGGQATKVRIKLHDKQAALVSVAKIFGLLTGDSLGVSVVVNDAEKVELSTLTIEQLRAGVRYLGQISGVQALPERQFGPDSPTATHPTATED
jgi:hypothetical protein